jgi:clathrin heavy chain
MHVTKGWLCSEKYGLAYVVSKMGLLFVYAVDNLAAVYRQRISADPVFLAQVRGI